MPDDFVNPYHFVPLTSDSPGKVSANENDWPTGLPAHLTHDRYVAGTLSGTIQCTLRTISPLVVGANRSEPSDGQPADVKPYLGMDGKPAIPATSLRGLLSNVYEAATNSALRVLANEYFSVRVPADPGKPLPSLGRLMDGCQRVEMLNLNAKMKVLGYEKVGNDTLRVIPTSFLDNDKLFSTSADHPETWFVPHGSNPKDARPSLQSSQGAIPGVLRILGIEGREKNMPMERKQERFVPTLRDGDVFTVPDEVLQTFYELADARTKDDPKLPYHVLGSSRKEGEKLRLRDGDLVYFRSSGRSVTELAVSQVWRSHKQRCHDYFASVSPDLLPFNPKRQKLTLAEQVFGVVEDMGPRAKDKVKVRQARALASRLRFSEATLSFPAKPYFAYDGDQPRTFVLQELSNPKPPCPSLYFKRKSGNGFIAKIDLKPGEHVPQGRKFYVHRDVPAAPVEGKGKQAWETVSTDDSALKRKSRVQPLKSGLTFGFTVTFTNLTPQELGFLLYALRPNDTYRHKLGMGKPLGLGQVEIRIDGVEYVNRHDRYSKDDPFVAKRESTGPDWQDLRATVRREAPLKAQFEAIERLGDPANTKGLAVHYPQLAGITPGTQAFEENLYEWFMSNEKGDTPQMLAPLTGNGPLPKLRRVPKHVPKKQGGKSKK